METLAAFKQFKSGIRLPLALVALCAFLTLQGCGIKNASLVMTNAPNPQASATAAWDDPNTRWDQAKWAP